MGSWGLGIGDWGLAFANRGTDYKENHPLFSEDFFTDSNRSLYCPYF